METRTPPDIVAPDDGDPTFRVNEASQRRRVSDSGANSFRARSQLNPGPLFPSHCGTERRAQPRAGRSLPSLEMAISFSSPATARAVLRGAGVTAVLGPTNTGKTHLAIERMLGAFVGHDRAAAAAAGARGLQQDRRPGRRRERRAHHRRGEDQAAKPALLGGDRRGHAARSRRRLRRHRRGAARRRSRARPCLHRPHAQPPRPRGDAGARRRDRAADGRAAVARRAYRHAGRGSRR